MPKLGLLCYASTPLKVLLKLQPAAESCISIGANPTSSDRPIQSCVREYDHCACPYPTRERVKSSKSGDLILGSLRRWPVGARLHRFTSGCNPQLLVSQHPWKLQNPPKYRPGPKLLHISWCVAVSSNGSIASSCVQCWLLTAENNFCFDMSVSFHWLSTQTMSSILTTVCKMGRGRREKKSDEIKRE